MNKVPLKLVRCYIDGCNREVIGKIKPTYEESHYLFVCRYHYERLAQIFIAPKYSAESGWFTDITQEGKK